MKHNGYVIFQRYIQYEINQIKEEYKLIRNNSYDIYQMLYKTRYYNGLDMDKILPSFLKKDVTDTKPFYTIKELETLNVETKWKNLVLILLANEPKLEKLKIKYNKLLPYHKMCMTMYVNLLLLYWVEIGKILLKGYKVSLGFGLGTLQIIRKMTTGKNIDWYSSLNYKRMLLLRGIRPYDPITNKGVEWIIRRPKAVNMLLRWRAGMFIKKQSRYKYLCKPLVSMTLIEDTLEIVDTFSEEKIKNNYNITLLTKAYLLALKNKDYQNTFEFIEYSNTKETK